MMTAGESVKAVRKIAGLTQAQLAELVGVSHGYIRKVEVNQEKLSLQLAKRIQDDLGLVTRTPFNQGQPVLLALERGTQRVYTNGWFKQWRKLVEEHREKSEELRRKFEDLLEASFVLGQFPAFYDEVSVFLAALERDLDIVLLKRK